MVKLKCLIFFYFVVNVVYLLTMVFDFNPLIQIKEIQSDNGCKCKYNSPRNIHFNQLGWQKNMNKTKREMSRDLVRWNAPKWVPESIKAPNSKAKLANTPTPIESRDLRTG